MTDTLAIDIGGTKIDAARVDGDGRILERYRLPTEGANAEGLFDGLVALVEPPAPDVQAPSVAAPRRERGPPWSRR